MKAGKLSELILSRSVLKKIRNKRKEILCGARTGNDAAVMKINGDLTAACAASSSFSYLPRNFTDSDCCLTSVLLNAELTVLRAANSVSAEWGEPFSLMPVLLLPEGFEESELKKVVDMFEKTAEHLNLQIAGGHSEISAYVKRPVFSVTVFGNRKCFISDNTKAYGQDIIMTGYAASEATRVMTALCRKKLEERFAPLYIEKAAEYTCELSVIKHMETARQNNAAWMHDLSETGVFGGLWELGEKLHAGMEIELKKIPIRQETIEFSEYMACNPYTVPSLGAALITAEDGNGLVRELERQGIPAVVIGKITEGKDRVLVHHEERRYLEQPR
ncbi:MAG: hydrogenase maturation factor [Lachnospiraceae bacterium]|nr:hydrogenase maturation factor [Lachnospiraceae bacterium]